MTELEELLERLKSEQRDIILRAAQTKATPARSAIQRIGELELAIGAVEQLINESEGASSAHLPAMPGQIVLRRRWRSHC